MINLPPRYANVLKTFSAGSMAITLLCEDQHLKRKVVVKGLKPGIEAQRLVDELAALSAIRSRYVVQVLDILVESGQPVAFVEEYLPGNQLIPCVPGATTVTDALKALYPIAAGISEIHDHQRVHRDIKPDNMRCDAEGQLKIFDFGLAKLDTNPGTKVLYYSDGFAAPESFKQNAVGLHTFDFALDVYSFGCVAVWMLNNGTLFPEMSGLVPKLPLGFDFMNLPVQVDAKTAGMLRRCLENDPSGRPAMTECKEHIRTELLRSQHKMTLTSNSGQVILDASRPKGTVNGNGSSVSVMYDGISFAVVAVIGSVSINNFPASVGQILFGSSVIVLRGGNYPLSVTCDISHPEVTL